MERKFKIINLKEEEDEKKQDDSSDSYFYPTPNVKEKKIAKPDFSPLLITEKINFKTNGSYKKRKLYEPESPYKLNNKNYSASTKIEGRDLFNSKRSHCRKLNFVDDEEEEKMQNSSENNKIINNNINMNLNNNFCFNIFDQNFVDRKKSCLKQNKMEKEFLILKTIKSNKLDYVYKVEEQKTKTIYCIKKINKKSNKNDINNTSKLFNEMIIKNNYKNIINVNTILLGYDFCNHYKDFWIEEENFDIINNILPEKYLYILYDYYPNGDLLDYLEKLE